VDRSTDSRQAQRTRKIVTALFMAGTVGITAILSFPISRFSPFRSPPPLVIPRALDPPEPLLRPLQRPLPSESREPAGPSTTRRAPEEAPPRVPGDRPKEDEESDDRLTRPPVTSETLTIPTLTRPAPPTTTKENDGTKATKRCAGGTACKEATKSTKSTKSTKCAKSGKATKPKKDKKPKKR
jgi:hypothetical protein